jgi:hypothetical protein
VTYGGDGGDGLVDNNNALTSMASALKIPGIACKILLVQRESHVSPSRIMKQQQRYCYSFADAIVDYPKAF